MDAEINLILNEEWIDIDKLRQISINRGLSSANARRL
ncbi:MAG: hypothetical protein EZS28_043975, partial [Streblomastix strix]